MVSKVEKLRRDCAILKPAIFPADPHILKEFYKSIQAEFAAATGIKKWLLDKSIAAKEYYLNDSGAVNHAGYDMLFGKNSAYIGGYCRTILTNSDHIDKHVVDFLKMAFSCPILESYGLTESGA